MEKVVCCLKEHLVNKNKNAMRNSEFDIKL